MKTQRHTSSLLGLLMIHTFIWQPVQAAPIDEFRLSDIEQSIRTLETTVKDQARQIAELQRQSGHTILPVTTQSAVSNDSRWVSSSNWARIKPGMEELQVIEILGAPTQPRMGDDSKSRTLLYAMEIGRSGFLSGRVTLTDGKVSSIEIPSLK